MMEFTNSKYKKITYNRCFQIILPLAGNLNSLCELYCLSLDAGKFDFLTAVGGAIELLEPGKIFVEK